MTEIEILKRTLADAEADIAALRLQVANLLFMLKREMAAVGSLPKPKEGG